MIAKRLIYILAIFLLIFQTIALADYKERERLKLSDASGEIHELFVTGDEYVRILHDEYEYVMTLTEDGYYEYARLENGILVPNGKDKVLKLSDIPSEYFENEREKIFSAMREEGLAVPGENAKLFSQTFEQKVFKGEGTVIVVPIAFNGGSKVFSGLSQTVENACDFFYEVSGGNLVLDYLDVSEEKGLFTSSQKELYYHPWSFSNPIGYSNYSTQISREKALVREALEFYGIRNESIDSPTDVDGDGFNDFLVFVYNAEYDTAWESLLWPHQTVFEVAQHYVFGKKVDRWIFVENNGKDTTLCHEMYHAIGAPDLYDYNGSYSYMGMWDLMENGNGAILTYMRYRYGGWIDEIPEITESGTYTLNPAFLESDNCYKIPINNNEYYVLEYRTRFSGKINQLDNWRQWHNEGLLITRVDERYSGEGNMYSDNVRNEINLVKHPALGVNSILGAVLPEFSPESGFDRTLQSGGIDDRTVIKNIRENSDGTLSFDVSFDGIGEESYQPLDDVEIKASLLQDSNGNVYCKLDAYDVIGNSDGTVSYQQTNDYGMKFIYLTGNENSANTYQYTSYRGPFGINSSGVLWAYLTDENGTRIGKPYYTYVHYNLPAINTAKNIFSWEYDTSKIFQESNVKWKTITFEGGDKFVGKLNMDRVITFTVDGDEYELLTEDIQGKRLIFDADVVNIEADLGSEVNMKRIDYQDFEDKRTVNFDSKKGKRSLFEDAHTMMPDDELSLEVFGDFTGEIRYTIDGTRPDNDSSLYTEPLDINEDTVIRCSVVENGAVVSERSFKLYVHSDYRNYSMDELNRVFKYSGTSLPDGNGKYIKIVYTPGEGELILRNSQWQWVKKISSPNETGVVYIPADDEIYVQEAYGNNITLSIVGSENQIDLTVFDDAVGVHNFGEEGKFQIVTAEFSDDRLVTAETTNVSPTLGSTEYLPYTKTENTVKVFCFDSLAGMKPMGISIRR